MELTFEIAFTADEIKEIVAKRAAEIFPVPAGKRFVARRCKYGYFPSEVIAELVDIQPETDIPARIEHADSVPHLPEDQDAVSEEVVF